MKKGRLSVLVLGGEPRHTIDIVRSLGKHDIEVSITSNHPHPPAKYSRYLQHCYSFDLSREPDETFLEFCRNLQRTHPFDVYIAAGLDGFRLLSWDYERLSEFVKIPVPSFASFSLAEDKAETIAFAQKIGIPVPMTYMPTGMSDLENYSRIEFPVVVKARRGQGCFGYARDFAGLKELYATICGDASAQIRDGLWPIIQEYIPGKGHGFYALMNRGELRSFFMHERLREVPPSGGPSSFARSYFDEHLMESGAKILESLGWTGVAMVEFKKDERDGKYKLLEINPKFWGSLGLSISAGVDFPYLLVKMAVDGDIEPVFPPKNKSVSYQWLSMDIAHSWAVGKPLLWFGSVLHGVPNDFSVSDPLPSLSLLAQGFWDVLRGNRRIKSRGMQ